MIKKVFFALLCIGLGFGLATLTLKNNTNKVKKEETPASEVSTDAPINMDEVTQVSTGLKTGDIVLDTKDAVNYINKNVSENFPEVRHMYYTAIDVVKWQMYRYPDFESIQNKSDKILHSTFCLANSIQQKDVVHIYKIIDLLVNWDYQYKSAYLEVNAYLDQNFKTTIPNISDIQKICTVFDKYPAEGFEFLYQLEN